MKILLAALALVLTQSVATFAADRPLSVSAEFDLSGAKFRNQTFFDVMSNKTSGIKAKLDKDYAESFEVVDVKTFRKFSSNFEHLADLEAKLKGGAKGLDTLISKLAGKTLTEDKMYSVVASALKSNDLIANPQQGSRVAGALIPIIALVSGKGVLVQLDSQTYCYNYGYAKGTGGKNPDQDSLDRKSGRSYGASSSRNAYDPSDNDYLKELGIYASNASAQELNKFYQTLFQILLKADTSGIRTLSDDGQTLMADFMAIYMAELDRHLMTGLTMYEWENALSEITMLAAYSASKGGMTLDPYGDKDNTVERGLIGGGDIKKPGDYMMGYFGIGTDGTGLDGRNKQRRHGLTVQVVREEEKVSAAKKAVVARIIEIIAAKPNAKGVVDIFDKVMEYINNFDTQDSVNENADELIDLLVKFVMNTRTDAAAISEGVN